MKTALISGLLGQDGPYLAKFLLEKNYKVYGIVRRTTKPNFENLDYLGIRNQVELITADMTDECSLINAVKTSRPDEIYNLAAQSFVGGSWDLATTTTETNAMGTLYLLNAMKLYAPNARFYQASTSEMYGSNCNKDGTQNELTPFTPKSPYAISKLYAYWITRNYRDSYGLYTCNGILFNHESPIRGLEFVTRKISNGVAGIALGKQSYITLGNLDSKRDWGFAGDYVKAMWLMLQQKTPGDYVIATGETHTIREFLDIAFNYVGIKDWEKHVKTDPQFKRPADVVHLHGDPKLANKTLKWKPSITFKQLVEMMVEEDIKRLK